MFDKLFEKTDKIVEQWEEPRRSPKPLTVPTTPTREPKRPRTPISPVPGKKPKPKAGVNVDVELFKAARKKMTEMAFDPGRFPDFVHPSKKQWIETGDEQLDKLLPRVSEGEQSYFEMITSKTYQEMLARLEKYTGVQAEDLNVPQIMGVTFQSLQKVLSIEKDHREVLEKLALDTLLNFPEFELVNDAYENGDLKFDIKLESPVIDFGADLEAEEDELSQAEEMNLELTDEFEELNELDLERRLANLLIQGNAVLKTYLFNMVKKEIAQIDEALPNLYGVLAVAVQFGYWIAGPGMEDAAQGQPGAGKEEVVPEDEGYIIKASGSTFPFLLHEIAKGIYEWISITEETGKTKGSLDTLKKETEDMIAGPELAKILASYIPVKKQELAPLVHKKVLKLSRDKVKEIFAKSEKGQRIMRDLVAEAEGEWKTYKRDQREADIEAQGL